jgi:hypothetical protein
MKRFLWFTVVYLLIISLIGCGDNGDTSFSNDNVYVRSYIVVQLTNGTNPYLVDKMTVSIQKSGGSVLTGVTNAQGIATITATSTGTYNVIQVAGVDATDLAESSEAGREFIKDNPLADPYPNLIYTYSATPSVDVTASNRTYKVDARVPSINKVTVLKVGSAASNNNGLSNVQAGTGAFVGRVMISNISSNDDKAGLMIASSDTNENRMLLYFYTTGISGARFYGGPSYTGTDIGYIGSYTEAGPIYFEAPGTDNGDWAIGYNLSATDLHTRGSASQDTNFPSFNGGPSKSVLGTWSTAHGTGHTYSFDYRIFQFDQY